MTLIYDFIQNDSTRHLSFDCWHCNQIIMMMFKLLLFSSFIIFYYYCTSHIFVLAKIMESKKKAHRVKDNFCYRNWPEFLFILYFCEKWYSIEFTLKCRMAGVMCWFFMTYPFELFLLFPRLFQLNNNFLEFRSQISAGYDTDK